jgi:ATP-binding cassette, subfamily B, multidrug efflux pump
MKKLFKYLKPYWKPAILAPILMAIEVVSDLFQPALLISIVDKGIPAGDIHFIVLVGLKMIGIALIGLVGGFGCIYTSSIASLNFGTDIRKEVFSKIQSFSFANLDQFKTSSLVTRLTNDIVQVQTVVMMMLRILVRFPLLCIGGIIITFRINPQLAVIFLIAIPILIMIIGLVMMKGFPLFGLVQKKVDKVNSVMQENLSGIRVVKAFVRYEKEQERFGSANKELKDISVKAFRIVFLMMPIMLLVMNFCVIAIIWFGGLKVHSKAMQVGQVMAFFNYSQLILFSLMMISFVLIMLSRAEASAKRINEVLETEVDVKNFPDPSLEKIQKGKIVFDHVFFHYKETREMDVLCDINLTLEAGKTIAFLGSTGSGKTSLVSLIPRLYDPTKGRILIDDRDIKEYDLETLRRSIGFVLQETILFSGSVKDNLRWGKDDATDEEIIEACRAAQAHDFIQSFPDQYDTQLGQMGVNLSGGQKQRLAIARAILKKPKILILDDSTSAVDMSNEAKIQKSLKQILKGSTNIIIAQRINSVIDADKIIILDDGEIKGSGTHEELLKSNTIYQDIYESQIKEGADFDAEQ